MSKVRVRFAPSPTGGLHIGGVRTALFNYLFAKSQGGDFILRIEDTDRSRFVEGAEQYIIEALKWLEIPPDEGPENGPMAPYRQSERQALYREYADQLLKDGHAYIAFDTSKELEEMKERHKANGVSNPQYDSLTRGSMRNSLTLTQAEVSDKIEKGEPYVIRAKIPAKEEIRFNDAIRGWVKVHGSVLDDKVLMKSDGMPTYHLANVVDDKLMGITHVIRGEEWLPSTPLHVLLYRFFKWDDMMPTFAHLPLILKPDGNGKLSKRAADKAGFPIFPLNWNDNGELSPGFREAGFLPDALRNFLVLLGWSPGTDQELFTTEELIQSFSLDRINKAGTKFDMEKAKWFNQQYIKQADENALAKTVIEDLLAKHSVVADDSTALRIVALLKERVTYPWELAEKSIFLFIDPTEYDEKVVRKKWDAQAMRAMQLFSDQIAGLKAFSGEQVKTIYSDALNAHEVNPGKYMQVLRLCISGQAGGPDLMEMLSIMGGKKVADRINYSIDVLNRKLGS